MKASVVENDRPRTIEQPDVELAIEEDATTAPPAMFRLPTLVVATQDAQATPTQALGRLAELIGGIQATEPPPKPAPVVHRRPQSFFE